MAREKGHHQPEALKHRHKLDHVPLPASGRGLGTPASTHAHEHNHPALEPVHIPHRDVDKEHRREAHVHDHALPQSRPRKRDDDRVICVHGGRVLDPAHLNGAPGVEESDPGEANG